MTDAVFQGQTTQGNALFFIDESHAGIGVVAINYRSADKAAVTGGCFLRAEGDYFAAKYNVLVVASRIHQNRVTIVAVSYCTLDAAVGLRTIQGNRAGKGG